MSSREPLLSRVSFRESTDNTALKIWPGAPAASTVQIASASRMASCVFVMREGPRWPSINRVAPQRSSKSFGSVLLASRAVRAATGLAVWARKRQPHRGSAAKRSGLTVAPAGSCNNGPTQPHSRQCARVTPPSRSRSAALGPTVFNRFVSPLVG